MVNLFSISPFLARLSSIHFVFDWGGVVVLEMAVSQLIVLAGSILSALVSVIAIMKGVVPLHNQLTILMSSFEGAHGQRGVMQRLSEVEKQHARLSVHVEQGIIPKLDDISKVVNEIRDR